ncbi:MAG: hypothetical protein N3D16_05275, partial [Anaerolineales bacterium]|nr:hypothetical protein [Anaerolineales bacterium]
CIRDRTRGLDERAKERLSELLRTFKSKGMAILVVTHDVEFVLTLADRLCVLKEGKMIRDGNPIEVLGQADIPPAQLLQLFPDQGFRTMNEVWEAMDAALSHTLDKSDRRAAHVYRNDGNKPLPLE